MRINTVKLLQAGGYVDYQPISHPQMAQPEQTQQQQQPGQGDVDSYLDKNVMEKMLGQGITTDVMAYSQQLQQAYQEYQYMNDFQRNTYRGRQIRNMLKGDLGQLNALMRSKSTFDDAIKNAKDNDSLNEFAVTNNGMVVRDNETGRINTVSFAQYAADNANGKNKKYSALTNAELAEQREYNRDLIGNSAVFGVLNFGKGMSKVQDEVYKAIDKVGNSKTSIMNGQFQTTNPEDIQQLMQAARAGAFKIKNGESTETNAPQIKAAQQALWMNLSENSRAVLRARAAAVSTNPDEIDQRAYNMMSAMLDSHLTTSDSKVFDESLTKQGRGGAGASMKDLGPFGLAFSGGTNTIDLGMIGPKGAKIQGFANALPVEAYTGKDNQRLPLRNAGKLNNISYLNQAFTANGDKVNPDLTVITGDAYVTDLPFVKDENGNYKIDEEGAKKYAEFKQKLADEHIQPNSEAAAKLQEAMGVANLQLRKFVVAEASSYADDYFNDRDSKYYDKITDAATKKELHDIVDPDNQLTQHAHFFHNDAHKHLIFIPAKDEASFNSMDGNNAKVPESVYEVARGYNTGVGGMNIARGTPLYNPNLASQLNLTTDFLKSK